MERFPRLLPLPLLAVVAVSLAALAVILHGTAQQFAPLYYALMCGLGWAAFGGNRGPVTRLWLRRLPGPVMLRAILLGYAAVILEETLVGTLYAINEGGTVAVLAERVRQFISFNLLAFTGHILGLTLACRLFAGVPQQLMLIAGVWGLFAERTYLIFLGNPIAGALIAGPNIAVYTIILAPLVLSMPDRPGKPKVWLPLMAWALMLALSLPAVALLGALRQSHPQAFPNCDYIACD